MEAPGGDEAVTLGQRLKAARRMANLTQEQVGDALGVADGTVSEWERDRRRPDPETLAALARLYRVSADYLLGLAEAPTGAAFAPVSLPSEPRGRREAVLLIEALEAAVAHLRERYAV